MSTPTPLGGGEGREKQGIPSACRLGSPCFYENAIYTNLAIGPRKYPLKNRLELTWLIVAGIINVEKAFIFYEG